jgi:hypothetical protein
MTIRRITEEQFESGSAIDGSRIQKALTETEEYFNNIPLEAIKEKYSLNYMVFTSLNANVGYINGAPTVPINQGGYFHYSPFLPCDDRRILGGVFHPPIKRVKGSFREERTGIDSINNGITGEKSTSYRVFTASTIFDRPVIIDSVCVFMMNRLPDAVVRIPPNPAAGEVDRFQGDQKYTTLDGAGRSKQRTRILIDTDDVVSAEDRTLNSKEFVLQDFQEAFWAPQQWTGAAAGQMSPETSESPLGALIQTPSHEGLFLLKENVNIPIHQFSRVRFRVVSYAPGVPAIPTAPDVSFLKDIKPENMTFTVVYKEALISG